jgi:hypothetical protein
MSHLPTLSPGVERRKMQSGLSGPRAGLATHAVGNGALPKTAAGSAATALEDLLELPHYATYCGYGHGDPTGCSPAVDEVDRACCKHDQCWKELGSNDCRCEKRIIADVSTAIAEEAAKGNVEGVAAGEIIRQVFTWKPCICEHIGSVPIWVPNPVTCPRF